MSEHLWAWDALDLAAAIRRKQVSCREAVESVLSRIADVNPRINALPYVLGEEALAAADGHDRALASGRDLGILGGVPVTIKVNVDQAGWPTTDGIRLNAENRASEDSPSVATLKAAGAIPVGRSNTPAFSRRWFTDNELHGRTLNPWDRGITPGGSSGGAAAALATGMGAIAHGNDLGGSIRYPAYACGVVGLRPTTGRIASYNATSKIERSITLQLMAAQGPLARTVADCRAALAAMAKPDPRDPTFVPAPLEQQLPNEPIRVALFKQSPTMAPDPAVAAALDQASRSLGNAGFRVEEAVPPHFDEAVDLWRMLVHDENARAVMEEHGGAALRQNVQYMFAGIKELDRDAYLKSLARRLTIQRDWSVFLDRYPVLLMPVSWRVPFPIDEDTKTAEQFEVLVAAQGPITSTAMLGLPGLAVPTGLSNGVPVGVQIVANRFREDLCFLAGEAIERQAERLMLDDARLPQ